MFSTSQRTAFIDNVTIFEFEAAEAILVLNRHLIFDLDLRFLTPEQANAQLTGAIEKRCVNLIIWLILCGASQTQINLRNNSELSPEYLQLLALIFIGDVMAAEKLLTYCPELSTQKLQTISEQHIHDQLIEAIQSQATNVMACLARNVNPRLEYFDAPLLEHVGSFLPYEQAAASAFVLSCNTFHKAFQARRMRTIFLEDLKTNLVKAEKAITAFQQLKEIPIPEKSIAIEMLCDHSDNSHIN